MHKTGQSGGFLGRLLGPLLTADLSLMKNLLKLLAKNVLIPLGSKATESATDATNQKKMFGSGRAKLIISNEGMNDIMKIVRCLEEPGFQ